MNENEVNLLSLESQLLKSPIFIGGEGRSGTRLLRNTLGKHRNIYEIERETYFFVDDVFVTNHEINKLAKKKDFKNLTLAILAGMYYKKDIAIKKIRTKNYDPRIVEMYEEISDLDSYKNLKNKFEIFNTIANYLCIKNNKKRWVEKTPFNIYSHRKILKIYPSAKIIVIYRDPRAVCASWLKKDKLKSLIGICLNWNKAVKQMEKLSNEIPHKFYMIRYEDLVKSPKTELMRLCEFIDEPFDDSMLDIEVTNSYDSKFQKGFNSESIDRWNDTLSNNQKVLIDLLTKQSREKLQYRDTLVKVQFSFLLFFIIEIFNFIFNKTRKSLKIINNA